MTTPPEDPKTPPRPRRRTFARTRANFLTGLVVIAPIWLTIYLVWSFVGWIDSWVWPFIPRIYQPENLINQWLGYTDPADRIHINIRGVGVIIFLIFTILVGWIAKGFIGRSFLRQAEGIVERMPVVRSLYNALKQIAETVFAQSDTSFEKACLVEYPRKGIWAIAFISIEARGEINANIPRDEQIVSVFLPTTPNPTSGFLLFVPKSEVIELDMSVEDAAKLVISAGLVYPNPKDPKQPSLPFESK
jgi:uncharacterized membrane protein